MDLMRCASLRDPELSPFLSKDKKRTFVREVGSLVAEESYSLPQVSRLSRQASLGGPRKTPDVSVLVSRHYATKTVRGSIDVA